MITSFQEKVYGLCSKIPKGNVSTYKAISDRLKSSPRAVGGALRKNPYAPKVPCHRVIRSDGNIGGFKGSLDNKKKIKLLKSEGINLVEGKVTDKTKIIYSL